MKTLIWDFNGTIVDDLQLCLDIENYMLKERGMKAGYTKIQYRDLFCFPVKDYYRKIGYTFETESYDVISEEFIALYDRGFLGCPLVEGVEDKLREAHARGYSNVILSASRTDKLKEQVELLGLTSYFDEICGIDDLLAGSKIEMARNWMRRSGVRSEDCVYIGDTVHDFETAKALGITNIVLFAGGHQSHDVLKKTGAKVVDRIAEVQL